jgi:SAM-dependent methyltransferase
VLASVQYTLLKSFCKREKVVAGQVIDDAPYSKLDVHFGDNWPALVRERDVLDFGCGSGNEVIQIARAGARSVCGLDISENNLREARRRVAESDVADCCRLTDQSSGQFDVIFSIDSFEHYDDPDAILDQMYSLLRPDGRLFVSFGPPWFHPLGGHAFSPFPWAHIILSEEALVRWRNIYFPGRSITIRQSGINRMTIKRFKKISKNSRFRIQKLEIVPIRALRLFHTRLTREWTTSVVRAEMHKSPGVNSN